MQTITDLIEIAKVLAIQSHVAASKEVARELWRLAKDYQVKAAARAGGRLPDIGDPPVVLAIDDSAPGKRRPADGQEKGPASIWPAGPVWGPSRGDPEAD